MSYLKSKSEFNLQAAQVLIDDHDCFAPSVHCSYYGCFQYIKSKLNEIGITYEKIDIAISNSRQEGVRTLNSHQYPISLILNKIEEKSDNFNKKSIKDKINLLKTFRVISDYHNEIVDYPRSKKALELSNEIIKLINTSLK